MQPAMKMKPFEVSLACDFCKKASWSAVRFRGRLYSVCDSHINEWARAADAPRLGSLAARPMPRGWCAVLLFWGEWVGGTSWLDEEQWVYNRAALGIGRTTSEPCGPPTQPRRPGCEGSRESISTSARTRSDRAGRA
jgi:hypothetical protein